MQSNFIFFHERKNHLVFMATFIAHRVFVHNGMWSSTLCTVKLLAVV